MCGMQGHDPSPVRFARVADAALAYQTWGSGPAHVVIVPPMAQNIELAWERPEYRALFGRLGQFARIVHFDKRGTGASDRSDRMPTIDERVEDTVAVMEAAGVARAHLLGFSDGGPAAIALAATYPERVETLALFGSGARILGDLNDDDRAQRREDVRFFLERWGTDDSVTLELFAPSVAAQPDYGAWEPRYERQSASPAAMAELIAMNEVIDVRPLLGSVRAPTLLLHRAGDLIVSVERSREVVGLLPDARLVELEGDDHFAQIGDIDVWLDHYERFVAGAVTSDRHTPARPVVRIDTMGGFGVSVDGRPVPTSAWGSRQARLVCKRLAVAVDRPVPRDELAELLWPDELDPVKRGARLSVVLSNIRRVLGGGLVADRDVVALDLDAVTLDLAALRDAIAAGDDPGVVAAYRGALLPEDEYDDWAIAARQRLSSAVVSARWRVAASAAAEERWDDVIDHVHALFEVDRYDERAHELLVRALTTSGRHGEARQAIGRYETAMAELGVRPRDLRPVTDGRHLRRTW